ncbi:MAG TPA: DNA alkylation repair protein [Patescibacteria group bacterium]|nr:DNA alkylation repair protein [Patescibacteria group bacterium]
MSVTQDLNKLANKEKAVFLLRFFKTGKGQYGEGDVFLGITVPDQRAVAKKYTNLPLTEVEMLLHNKLHEYRLTALLILCYKIEKAGDEERKKIVDLYLANTKYINNWDLVDLSSHEIVGTYLLDHPKERTLLLRLAKSKSLWERRISMVACYALLRQKQFNETFAISEILLHDDHDLIHKAVGWMLRELGKMDEAAEIAFLNKHYKTMPRTMLRYAIEKFPEPKRKFYMS